MNRLLLILCFAAAPAIAAQGDRIIPLDTSGPRPTAQLTVAGRPPVTVIFDTGAGGSVLNTGYASTLKLPNQGSAFVASPGGKRLPAYFTTLPDARLGEADITGARAVVGDLGIPLPGISGVMSPNIFRGSLVRLELARSRAVITKHAAPSLPAHPYYGEHPLPAIAIEIAGKKLQALIDTGSGRGLTLPLELARDVRLKGTLVPTGPALMAGAERRAFASRIDGVVQVGPLTLADPDVVLIEGFRYASVGFAILKDLTIVLSPGEQRGWLLPTE